MPHLHALPWTSPIGLLRLVGHDSALCGVYFADQPGVPAWAADAPVCVAETTPHPLQQAIHQLHEYFQGRRQQFELPLAWVDGTEFQRQVWQALAAIPYGATVSYGELAAKIGRPRAVRALGGAVGRNPLGIVLPCHRVVGAQGQLTGYTGGLERKVALLQLEAH